ncbi:hypothetical protein [Glacieibacterium sp.]|uniref:hypothetical protein n=1 Tax=Glacieibacterium sp. TaxID=2860237 RepID=UPI003B00C7D3
MSRPSYREGDANRKRGGLLPGVLVGVAGYVLWRQRDALGEWLQSFAGDASPDAASEQVPDDYDWNRPSVFNSTAMAGPKEGAGATVGYPGGTMGTDPGTQGEGAQ